jgi:type II secretory pathway component PulF
MTTDQVQNLLFIFLGFAVVLLVLAMLGRDR